MLLVCLSAIILGSELSRGAVADVFPENSALSVVSESKPLLWTACGLLLVFAGVYQMKGGRKRFQRADDADRAKSGALARLERAEKLRVEAQAGVAQKAEAVEELAAGVAHHFNNILAIIGGHSSVLLDAPPREAQEAKSLREICSATDRAAKLVQQLLLLSRTHSMESQWVSLNQAVRAFVAMSECNEADSVRTRTELASELPEIIADPEMLQQLLGHLASNARDAVGARGEIVISTELVELGEEHVQRNSLGRPGTFVCLSVKDDGKGMEAHVKERIFEPFFSTKPAERGAGLGLAIAHGIVRGHQGWIEVNSAPDQGTEFRIFLPADPGAAPSGDVRSVAKSRTILLVEDDGSLRSLIGHRLECQQYTVLYASRASEALRLWGEHKDEIQVVMIAMAIRDRVPGADLVARIRRDRAHLPVIFTSEPVETEPVDEWVHFAPKPHDASELLDLVRRSFQRAGAVRLS